MELIKGKYIDWILNRTGGDKIIWAVIGFLSIVGLLAVYSSTGTLAYKQQGGNTEFYLIKQVVFIAIGLFLIYLCHKVNYKYYSKISQILLFITPFLLIYTLFFGTEINDASRWITIPLTGITFQTSDLAKLSLIMYVARFLSKKQDDIKDFKKSFLPIIGWISLICVLIAPANLSTALVLFFTCLILLFLGRINMLHLSALVLIGLVSGIIFAFVIFKLPDDKIKNIARLSTWKHRIETFMATDNSENENGEITLDDGSYQNQQAKIAIANGGLFGKGPGKSTQRNFLPHPYSDFIFAIILEEYGLIGGVFVILAYLILLFRSILIVKNSPKAFGALLAFGLSLSLVIQAFINMGVAVNIFPVTGLPLPLVSMGGTSMIFTSIAFGIILSVSRSVEELEPKNKEEAHAIA